MAITQDGMDAVSRSLFMPVMLMLDFGMFQYLVPVYYPRRRERRVQMLLLASFIGFASHVYFEHDIETMLAFNDISEACAQLTFLIQITIIGHAVRAKVKLRSITWFTYAAEALIVLDWVNMLASTVEAAGVELGDGTAPVLERVDVCAGVSLLLPVAVQQLPTASERAQAGDVRLLPRRLARAFVHHARIRHGGDVGVRSGHLHALDYRGMHPAEFTPKGPGE